MNNSKEEMILAALLATPTIKKAAEVSEVPESTIYSYLRKSDFKQRYEEAKADTLKQATTFLQGRTALAVEVINEIAGDKKNTPQTRLAACRTLLEYSIKLTETIDIIQRLETLSQIVEESI